MQIEIRHEIAERLSYELKKRSESKSLIAEKYNLDENILTAYLKAEREINIEEIRIICNQLNINPSRLLFDKEYPKVKISYRNSAHNVQNFASTIEDIFLLIRDSLPKVKIPIWERELSQSCSRSDIVIEASSYSNNIKKDFNLPINFLYHHSIPVLPLSRPDIDFDAFLLRESNKVLICINSSRPLQRINFSLAHEISHLLFDKFVDVPIDSLLPDFYWREKLNPNEISEFFAYKFAEFYLIPFESASRLAEKWPRIDIQFAQDLVNKGITTKDVLANAIFDTIPFTQKMTEIFNSDNIANNEHFKRMDWEDGRDKEVLESKRSSINFQDIINHLDLLQSGSDLKALSDFLNESQKLFIQFIESEHLMLSDEVYEYIMGIVKFEK
jgi:hypothetical protein